MLLTRFSAMGATRFGVVEDNVYYDLSRMVSRPQDLAAVANTGDAGASVIRVWQKDAVTFRQDEVRRLLPVSGDYRVFCAALNYPTHVQEGNFTTPSEPLFFFKLPASLIDPDDDIVRPVVTNFLDYEGELAVVLGRTATQVDEAEALDYVLGYCVMNEMSARDLQRRDERGQRVTDWFSGKALDATSPLGPYIVTRDEIPDPHALSLVTRLNGDVVQEASTGEMIFSIPQLIAYLSRRVALQPFDVIATGTPAGVGSRRSRKLGQGDVIEVTVSGVGQLTNRVLERV